MKRIELRVAFACLPVGWCAKKNAYGQVEACRYQVFSMAERMVLIR